MEDKKAFQKENVKAEKFRIEGQVFAAGAMDREELKKELLRKIAHRKFALESYDLLAFVDSDNPLSEKESYRKLKNNLIDAKELAFQDGYFAIISKRKIIGKLEVFWKKAVRKLIKIFYGWYIFPIYKRQTDYNELMVQNLRLMQEILGQQQEEIENLKEEICILRGNEIAPEDDGMAFGNTAIALKGAKEERK